MIFQDKTSTRPIVSSLIISQLITVVAPAQTRLRHNSKTAAAFDSNIYNLIKPIDMNEPVKIEPLNTGKSQQLPPISNQPYKIQPYTKPSTLSAGGGSEGGGNIGVSGKLLEFEEYEALIPIPDVAKLDIFNTPTMKAVQNVLATDYNIAFYKLLIRLAKEKKWYFDTSLVGFASDDCLNITMANGVRYPVACQDDFEVRINQNWWNNTQISTEMTKVGLVMHELILNFLRKGKKWRNSRAEKIDMEKSLRAINAKLFVIVAGKMQNVDPILIEAAKKDFEEELHARSVYFFDPQIYVGKYLSVDKFILYGIGIVPLMFFNKERFLQLNHTIIAQEKEILLSALYKKPGFLDDISSSTGLLLKKIPFIKSTSIRIDRIEEPLRNLGYSTEEVLFSFNHDSFILLYPNKQTERAAKISQICYGKPPQISAVIRLNTSTIDPHGIPLNVYSDATDHKCDLTKHRDAIASIINSSPLADSQDLEKAWDLVQSRMNWLADGKN